jgi:hypothetical protein
MKRRTKAAWEGLVAGQARSGLTIAAYCRRERICTASFYRWRGILGAAPHADVGPAAEPATTRPAFVDLGPLMRSGQRVELRVELGAGVVLQLSRG